MVPLILGNPHIEVQDTPDLEKLICGSDKLSEAKASQPVLWVMV